MASGYCRIYVGVLALLVFHVQKGQAVRCFSCSSKQNEACVEPDTDEYVPVRCDWDIVEQLRSNARDINKDYDKIFEVDALHTPGVDFICLKVVMEEGNKKYVVRGCQLGLHSNLDICTKVEEKSTGMYKLLHCSKCNKDGCNASMSYHRFSTALILFSLVVHQAISRL